jgi:hypothetical protein
MDWGQTSSSCSLSVLLIALRRWRVLWIRAELEGKLSVGSLTAAQLVVTVLAMPGLCVRFRHPYIRMYAHMTKWHILPYYRALQVNSVLLTLPTPWESVSCLV